MIVDELVTILKFDMPSSSKTAINDVQKMIGQSASAVEDFGNKSNKGLSKTDDLVNGLASSWKAVGLAISIAGAGMASAAGLTIHASKEANELKNLANELGVTAEELSVWSSAVHAAGGSAEAFRSDLQRLKQERGQFTFDFILKDADKLKELGSLSEAMNQGKSWGYQADSVRFMYQGSEGILKKLEESKDLGHGMMQRHADDLQTVYQKYSALSETIGGTVNRIGGEFAPGVSKGLDAITQAIAGNREAIDGWVKGAAGSFESLIDILTMNVDKIESLDERISAINGKKVSENLSSPDPAMRKAEIANIERDTSKQSAAMALQYLPKIVMPGLYGEKGKNQWDYIGEMIDKLGTVREPLHQAAREDVRQTLGDKYSDTGDSLKDYFANYREQNGIAEPPAFLQGITDSLRSFFSPARSSAYELPKPAFQPGSFAQPLNDSELALREKYGLKVRPDNYGQPAAIQPLESLYQKTPDLVQADKVMNALNKRQASAMERASVQPDQQRVPAAASPQQHQTFNQTNNFQIDGAREPAAVAGSIIDALNSRAASNGFTPMLLP